MQESDTFAILNAGNEAQEEMQRRLSQARAGHGAANSATAVSPAATGTTVPKLRPPTGTPAAAYPAITVHDTTGFLQACPFPRAGPAKG